MLAENFLKIKYLQKEVTSHFVIDITLYPLPNKSLIVFY